MTSRFRRRLTRFSWLLLVGGVDADRGRFASGTGGIVASEMGMAEGNRRPRASKSELDMVMQCQETERMRSRKGVMKTSEPEGNRPVPISHRATCLFVLAQPNHLHGSTQASHLLLGHWGSWGTIIQNYAWLISEGGPCWKLNKEVSAAHPSENAWLFQTSPSPEYPTEPRETGALNRVKPPSSVCSDLLELMSQ